MLKILALAAVAAGVGVTSINYDIPVKYQGNRPVTVDFVGRSGIDKYCGKPSLPNREILACVNEIGGDTIYITNPCVHPDNKNSDSYAHTLCHELAHTNGWVHPPSG